MDRLKRRGWILRVRMPNTGRLAPPGFRGASRGLVTRDEAGATRNAGGWRRRGAQQAMTPKCETVELATPWEVRESSLCTEQPPPRIAGR
jgi:hypothetical protein